MVVNKGNTITVREDLRASQLEHKVFPVKLSYGIGESRSLFYIAIPFHQGLSITQFQTQQS